MSQANCFTVSPGYRILFRDLGINAVNVLRLAELPGDLFAREQATLKTAEYFRLWRAIEKELNDPTIPIRIGSAISVEAFDPPIFAALHSPNLNTALARIARYKKLVAPMALHVEVNQHFTSLDIEWLDKTLDPPEALVAAELVFFVQLARLATRTDMRPLKVTTLRPPSPAEAYASYFGVAIKKGKTHSIMFSAEDARRPFLAANEKMLAFFEPELNLRLSELEQSATMTERVSAALMELLPTGSASIQAVSTELGISVRTLQRRLQEEGGSFQLTLDRTREQLARHYLKRSKMSGAEISFLLGFEDPNSFIRAFHSWTGSTPELARKSLMSEA